MAVKDRNETEKREILKEARDRFKRCQDWEAVARERFEDDLKFVEGDSYNGYQWPEDVRTQRESDAAPVLTINQTKQHILNVLNDARQSKIAISIKPTGGEATFESAQLLEGIVRYIEYQSRAGTAYQHALSFAIRCGIGYCRLTTDYVGDDTFDQDIFIRRVKDPRTVYLDPDINEFDGSDATFGFVFTDMPNDQFKRSYPKYKDKAGQNGISASLGNDAGLGDWITKDHVRVAEYFRCVPEDDKLIGFTDPQTGQVQVIPQSKMDKALLASVIDDPNTMVRNTILTKVEHFMICGDEIMQEKEWYGRYIPLARCIGEETVIDGEMDRKGLTRALLDPQRMLNYNGPLSLDTLLPTPDGWTTMGRVAAGDWLLDEHGKPVQVAGTSPTFINRDCYRVTFDDGSEIVADAGHKWTVDQRYGPRPERTKWTTETVTTEQLTPKKHFIWVTDALDLPAADLPIDPYVLGVWLGDGDSSGSRISSWIGEMHETRANLAACGYNVGEPRVYGTKTASEITVFGLKAKLRDAGLLGRKHIPREYLRASREQRLALLQGLMDTDGNISKAKQCSFITSRPALALGMAELLRSLGLKATAQELPAMVRMVAGSEKSSQIKPATRFAFSANPDTPVFRLSRKRGPQSEARPIHERRTKRHRIVSVVQVPSVPVKCVGIDSESHLFLAGEGMVPTHNSAAIQFGALQSKAPWLAPVEGIEGYEDVWANANIDPTAVLPYNGMDDSGNKIDAPQRVEPPTGAPVFMQGIQMAAEWMRNASGQYQADMGAPGNERSGTAITARQRQGDTATYHYLDHESSMVAHIGRMIIDLIPHVWDTQRIVKWRSETGDEMDVNVDPNAPQHVSEKDQTGDQSYQQTLNPTISWKYGVEADVGPAYATKRQEAFAAYTQILAQNKELTGLIGDIAMRFADFPGADEAAQRLRRMVPPQALGEGDAPDVVALKGQIAQMQKVLEITTQKLADKVGAHQNDQEKIAVQAYDSQTKRLTALQEAFVADPDGIAQLVRSVVSEAMATSAALGPSIDAENPPIEPVGPGVVGPDPSAPIPGGQIAPQA